ncbi:MAG TPA: S4 domain-containing protein [Pusillimonas sp.]|uniref:RNA-binding S4 domain-containing protein n=1 Tax=Pusillimonas sp. TaxID=3040095 RepID=UPI002C34A0CE|nr:S4 domain-containing protein [Pusillimonas sp.]HUH88781.1 S4 domain-containing protein [Pusillimonas sp.]
MQESMRLDKWLWAARFYKTRSLATQEINKGRIHVNQQMVKPAREIKPGDTLWIKRGDAATTVVVQALSQVRGPATVAQLLYAETPESIAAREKAAELRRLAPEPAQQITQGRPTKRDRRLINRLRNIDD